MVVVVVVMVMVMMVVMVMVGVVVVVVVMVCGGGGGWWDCDQTLKHKKGRGGYSSVYIRDPTRTQRKKSGYFVFVTNNNV